MVYIKKALKRTVDSGLIEGDTRWETKSGQLLDMTLKSSLLHVNGENMVLSTCGVITELKSQNIELKPVAGALRGLNNQLIEEIRLRKKIQLNLVNIEEREGKRMARELRDGVGKN